MEDERNFSEANFKRGRIISGIVLIIAGSLFFARKLGILFPDWLFTWQMFLIVLGVYIGAKHNFKNPSWLILVGLGVVFMLERFYPAIRIHEFFWPILLIAFGAMMLIKPARLNRFKGKRFEKYRAQMEQDTCSIASETNENKIDVTAVLGGIKKNVLSKDFKGGEINCIMGGAEVNLTQADILGSARLEINNIFGGTKLLIPANWEVVSDVVVVLGGIEDKRPLPNDAQRSKDKILYIEGSCVFGGIDIKSY